MTKDFRGRRCLVLIGFLVSVVAIGQIENGSAPSPVKGINLPSSKQLIKPVPGSPEMLNSLPMTIAISPDKRYLAVVNSGFGTFESKYQQSIAVLDTRTGKLTDFPEARTAPGLHQTLYSGLAFSRDGQEI